MARLIECLIPGKRITHLRYNDKEDPGLFLSDKNTTFDLLCEDEASGEQFLVEMQVHHNPSYLDRMLFYCTTPIRRQILPRMRLAETETIRPVKSRDPMDYTLMSVYVIGILNFTLPHEGDEALEEGLLSRYSIRNDHNGELMNDTLHFVFLELPRLKWLQSESDRCRTLLERLVFSLKYGHLMEERPKGFDDKLLDLLYTATSFANMKQEQYEKYIAAMSSLLDRLEMEQTAYKEGKEEGRDEGRMEGKRETAHNMLKLGIPTEIVSQATGFTAEEIQSFSQAQ